MISDPPHHCAAEAYRDYARHGDVASLEQALRGCADIAYTHARRLLGNASDADDAVQEAFLQLARSAHRYDESVPFPAWVGRLVQVACARVQRSDRRRRRRERVAMENSRNESASEELAEAVRAAVESLPKGDRTAIELHYFAGLSQAQTATAIGASENAVALRLSRARSRLREILARRGTALEVSSVATTLASQPAFAAPPAVMTVVSALSAKIASGAVLPTTTVSLPLIQKGLLVMSAHPIITAIAAVMVIIAAFLPAAMWAADQPAITGLASEHSPRPLASGVDLPWKGEAGELLPFIDPQATLTGGVDWDYLRRIAKTTKPFSLLGDPRAASTISHIREELRQLGATNGDYPDIGSLLESTHGIVWSTAHGNDGRDTFSVVADMSSTDAQDVRRRVDLFRSIWSVKSPAVATRIGPFDGQTQSDSFFGTANDRLVFGSNQMLIAGVQRRGSVVAPRQMTTPVWLRRDFTATLKCLGELDHDRSDPIGLGMWLGSDWRTMPLDLTWTLTSKANRWQSELDLPDFVNLPLRVPAPSIAGSVPSGSLASLVMGCDPQRFIPILRQLLGTNALTGLTKYGLDQERMVRLLSGDVALVVQPQAPIPAITLVIGLRSEASVDAKSFVDQLCAKFGFATTNISDGEVDAWNGVVSSARVQVALTKDRLVITSGDIAGFLSPPQRRINDHLALEVDLPACARLGLPLLYAQISGMQFDLPTPLRHLVQSPLLLVSDSPGLIKEKLPIDLDRELHRNSKDWWISSSLQLRWNQIRKDADLALNEHIAVFGKKESRGELYSNACVVYRLKDGWRVALESDRTTIPLDFQALGNRIKGLVRLGGADPKNLKLLPIEDTPTFDKRWLPEFGVFIDHLPTYKLTFQRTSSGMSFHEEGMPLLLCTGLILLDHLGQSAKKLHFKGVFEQSVETLRVRHVRALAALSSAWDKLQDADAKFSKPSQWLIAARIPLGELASLNKGVSPTVDQVDRLGTWTWREGGSPFGTSWHIPIGDGWFIVVSGHPFGSQKIDVTNQPKTITGAPFEPSESPTGGF